MRYVRALCKFANRVWLALQESIVGIDENEAYEEAGDVRDDALECVPDPEDDSDSPIKFADEGFCAEKEGSQVGEQFSIA